MISLLNESLYSFIIFFSYRPSNSIDVSSSQNESSISNNDTMNSDYRGSVQSLQSNSTIGETRNTPMRASARKKRKAPLPPPRVNSVLSTSAVNNKTVIC